MDVLEEWWLQQTGDVVQNVCMHILEVILYCLVTNSGQGGWWLFYLSGG